MSNKIFAVIAVLSMSATVASAQHCQSKQAHHQQAMTVHKVAVEHAGPNIVETAVGNPDFSTLVAAVQAAGLVDALAGEGPFTVFAPTNDAFAKLPAGTVENLLKPENKGQLTNILLYHVVPGKVLAADVVKLHEAGTLLEGTTVDIKVEDGKVFVDGAQVVATDIETSNGVIHVIDSVILP